MIYSIVGVASCFILIVVLVRFRTRSGLGFQPSDFFLCFFALTWSPLTFFPLDRTHLPYVLLSETAQLSFTVSYALMCLGISLGFVVSNNVFLRAFGRSNVARFKAASSPFDANCSQLLSLITVGSSLCLIVLYLSDDQLRQHLTDVRDYFLSNNVFSYNELRREVERGGFVLEVLHNRLQYSLVALFFVLNLILALRTKKKSRKTFYLMLAIALFIVCATSLNKRPYVYYFAIAVVTYLSWQMCRGISIRKILLQGLIGCGLAVTIITALYSLQYRDADRGLVENLNTLYFRVFLAYPAGYKLYTELYPSPIPFTYGRSVGLLQPILGSVKQPYKAVPEHYGEYLTTFPSGFISYAYSDFGMPGVVVFSVLVGALLRWLNFFVLSRRYLEVKVASLVLLGLSTNYLCNKSFFSSLLSGGLLLTPLAILVIAMACVSLNRSDQQSQSHPTNN